MIDYKKLLRCSKVKKRGLPASLYTENNKELKKLKKNKCSKERFLFTSSKLKFSKESNHGCTKNLPQNNEIIHLQE